MLNLTRRLRDEGEIELLAHFRACRSKLELIVHFLAVLELLRLGLIRVTQPQALGDIFVRPREDSQDAERILAAQESDFDKQR
jgi:chromatin segregation and condensation protein Rec8/ScpA/Scc1 (kleisin family)